MSSVDIACGKSCLLAKIKIVTFCSSSSESTFFNSSAESPIRSRSLLSTTNMRPCVF
uniref:Uncharacterized protein n=1 Tax=Schistosoma japonicum TaxID=6182 RepID=Q5BXE7_SCHJA|nr:unknown [Schistosoma japonicum]